MGRLLAFYDRHYKTLLALSIVIFLLSIVFIAAHWLRTGQLFRLSVSLAGGSTITLQLSQPIDALKLQAALAAAFPEEDFSVKGLFTAGGYPAIVVESTALETEKLTAWLEQELSPASMSTEVIGPALGASFFRSAIRALIITFVLMSVVMFIYFRQPLPAAYVVLAAIADVLFAWAGTLALGIPISTAGIAAFLMLIGYSVDTDVLLSARVLRGEGVLNERIAGAAKTGLTMTGTTLAAVTIALIIVPSEIVRQIMTVLLFGLIADLWNTWLLNAGLLRLYIEARHGTR